jgi:hypothetical protein
MNLIQELMQLNEAATNKVSGKAIKAAIEKHLGKPRPGDQYGPESQAQRHFSDNQMYSEEDVLNFFRGIDAEGYAEDVISIAF